MRTGRRRSTAFIPEEYWTLDADFNIAGGEKTAAGTILWNETKRNSCIHSKEEVNEILEKLKNAEYQVSDVKKGERVKKAPLPFTTSTLQQEASKALNFSTQKTMRLAQQLYEGVDIKGSGTVGLITYLRTDSTRVAEEAEKAASSISSAYNYGENYLSQRENCKEKQRQRSRMPTRRSVRRIFP